MSVPLELHFIGCGDTLGSGGRFQTCFSLRSGETHVLLDCGASSLVALKRFEVDPNSIETIFITHLHGDHFGGIPFLVLDTQFSRREAPLTVVGPPGTEQRVMAAQDILIPGSATAARRFELRFVELPERVETVVGAVRVTGFEVVHQSSAPAYALRLAFGDKVVGYSGDTEWTDALIDAARDADVFICEAYFYEKVVKNHLAYTTLRANRDRLGCRRLVLTHLNADLLARRDEVEDECAEDGLRIVI
ncbi:MAG: MBL fold metallo-hydrolase [Chloroflexi bacterium]|nr:MBL fold metallo-hydrolase [Chloroflexota bacterium]